MCKFELTNMGIGIIGATMYRIRALRDFSDVKKGDLGGFIERHDNLSHVGNCWISDDACVYEHAHVGECSLVSGNAKMKGSTWARASAHLYGNTHVCGQVTVAGNAQIFGDTCISGHILVSRDAQICNAWIHGDVWVSTNTGIVAAITGNSKIDHGVWTRLMRICNEWYLLSSTLEKILLG